MRYLLDDVMNLEANELSDALAPDKRQQKGCPTNWTVGQTTEIHNHAIPVSHIRSIDQKCQAIQEQLQVLNSKILFYNSQQNTDSSHPLEVESDQSTSTTSGTVYQLPVVRDWKDLHSLYCTADPSRHHFKAVKDWTPHERKLSDVAASRFSIVKLIAEEIQVFKDLILSRNPSASDESVYDAFSDYYTMH